MTDNLKIWNKLGKTNPEHTKGFTRSGGFKGTAIKPIYTEQKMTEAFGPVGTGWGFSEPQFQIIPGDNKEVLVFCTLSLWVAQDGKRSEPIFGVGGDKIVSHIKANAQYNKPERWENDDEAFKKAFTDALGNAMKHLGMSADVHMGMFEDSKYLRDLREEIADAKREVEKPKTKPATVVTLHPKPDANPLITEGNEAASRGKEIFLVFWKRLTKTQRNTIGTKAQVTTWETMAREADERNAENPFSDAFDDNLPPNAPFDDEVNYGRV